MPPQPNSPPDYVFNLDRAAARAALKSRRRAAKPASTQLNKQNIVQSSGISKSIALPLMLHLQRHFTKPD